MERCQLKLFNSSMASKVALMVTVLTSFGAFLYLVVEAPFARLSSIQLLEHQLADESLHLLPFPESKALSVCLQKADLSRYQIYAKNTVTDSYLLIDRDGQVTSKQGALATVKKNAHVLLTGNRMVLFVDDQRIPVDLQGFSGFFLTSQLSSPDGASYEYAEIDMADSFMRMDLFADSNWKSYRGKWTLNQHGGGLSEDRDWLWEPKLARAVNPFTVRGSSDGILSYGDADILDYRVEARFYFGVPQTAQVRDQKSLPTSFWLIQGHPEGAQIRFGWDEKEKRFVLDQKDAGGEWETVRKWKNLRPTITSWCKLALEVEDGYRARAYLDDIEVLDFESQRFISGPFHIAAGAGLIELDDVKALSLETADKRIVQGTPLFVKSTNFASKDVTERDRYQYEKWALGRDIFTESMDDFFRYLTSTYALFGDVYYQSIPHDAHAGEAKDGMYVFRFLEGSVLPSESPQDRPNVFSLKARRASRKWIIDDDRYPSVDGKTVSVLRLARLASHGNRPAVFLDRWVPLADPVEGFIHVSVGWNRGRPQPVHHEFRCSHLVNELFEEAPTEWCWTEGKFRMASRWACSSQWNFMACGGTGTPWMASKKRFWGDQAHEYYMSLRGVQPPEGGDHTFSYDEDEDRDMGFPIMKENHGWYNKHDLNFAFCSDGVNPLSGYAVIYASDENSRNILLRKGKIVAENTEQLMPGDSPWDYGPIHWEWWNFRCAKQGKKIVVELNDEVLFEYEDEDPLNGGHVGFFTTRNGFSVAKISSTAERIDRDPHFMWVSESRVETGWYPLLRDAVDITQRSSHTIEVAQRIGGGCLAMRYDTGGVDLEASPVLTFPLTLLPDTAINLFLSISGKPYVVQLNDSPLSQSKALLTPQFEKGEMFQLEFQDVGSGSRYFLGKTNVTDELRLDLRALLRKKSIPPPYLLESITLGNSSEQDFLTFGAQKNRRGAGYRVGKVRHER